MPLVLECPSGHRLKVPSKLAGHTIVCPVCEEKVDVPPLKAPPPAMLRPVRKPANAATQKLRKEADPSSHEPNPKPVQQKASEKQIASTPNGQQESAAQKSDQQTSGTQPPPVEKPPVVEKPEPPQEAPSYEAPLPNASTDPSPMSPVDVPALPDLPTIVESQEEAEPKPSIQQTSDVEQPWSAMRQLAEEPIPAPLPPMPVGEGEVFSEEQSFLIDQVVAERPTSPAWVFVDEEPGQRATHAKAPPQNTSVLLLTLSAIVVAVLTVIPALIEYMAATQEGVQPDRWTYIVLLGALVQVAVAILATSIPDWSTQWIGALVTTAFATMYALGLALTMFARQDHALVRDLGLLDEAFRNQAQPWCFCVLCMTLILAFCYGRSSLRWYHTEKQRSMSRTALPA